VARVTIGARLYHNMRQFMMAEQPDIVHVHSPLFFTLPMIGVRAAPCPVVGTYHSYFDRHAIYKRLSGLVQKQFVDKLDGQIAVSQSCVRALTPYLTLDARIIPNGIDLDMFSPRAPRLEKFDRSKLNLLFLSRLEPRTGLDLMIDAFIRIRRSFRDVRLIVVGDGPLRRQYERMVPPDLAADVHFEGRILKERPSYYATSDIYCAPISKASFGMTLLEAMATGKPIVATDNDGYRDLLGPEESVIVPTGDVRAFAEATLALLRDEPRRRAMGVAGLEKAQRFSWPLVVDQIVAFYEELVARR
jgi:phosphatidylinositol alpha-mannosyltransferase